MAHNATTSPWLTVPQAAAYLQVAPVTILRALRAGRLRSAVIGRTHRIHQGWLDSFLGYEATPSNWRDTLVEKNGGVE